MTQGATRDYLLYVPATYHGDQPVPLVFDFHGFGSSAREQIAYGDFRPFADQDGFVVVALDGQGTPKHFTLLGGLGGEPGSGEADDVKVTTDLLDHLEQELCIDPNRVYSAGMSNGGAISSIVACRAPDRFAAVGAVAAEVYLPACSSARPVAIAAFHGTSDPIVPFNGGTVNCCGNAQIGAAPATMQQFADHDGCATAPEETQLSPMVVRRRWTGCQGGAVEFYVIQGGGHTWPGSAFAVAALGATTKEIDASATLWQFFKAHPRPN
jgi:polyhydroxybutyrate depolymerase